MGVRGTTRWPCVRWSSTSCESAFWGSSSCRSSRCPQGQQPTLDDILAGRVKGQLYDAYRQSWVASPEPAYVAAGNAPLRAPVAQLQSILDAPQETVDVKGKPVPTVASGLSDAERQLLQSRGLLNATGQDHAPGHHQGRPGFAGETLHSRTLGSHLRVPKGDDHH